MKKPSRWLYAAAFGVATFISGIAQCDPSAVGTGWLNAWQTGIGLGLVGPGLAMFAYEESH
jgi:hypothetical protein